MNPIPIEKIPKHLRDYSIEYSISNRAHCRKCSVKIKMNELRIRKTTYDTEMCYRFGPEPYWYHINCFSEVGILNMFRNISI